MLVVRHHATGWVREIARKDEDAEIEAHFDPETGVVTVYEGRREFKALERAARRVGAVESAGARIPALPDARGRGCSQHAVQRGPQKRSSRDGSLRNGRQTHADYAAAVVREAQALRYRAHEKLMRAFLDDAVYDGRVRVHPEERPRRVQQVLLTD